MLYKDNQKATKKRKIISGKVQKVVLHNIWKHVKKKIAEHLLELSQNADFST